MRDLVAPLAMALAVPATIVGVDYFTGVAFRAAGLAPLLWATAVLAGVLALRRPRSARDVRQVVPAGDLRTAA